MKNYFNKMKGGTFGPPPRMTVSEILWSSFGIFISIGSIFYFEPFFRDITAGHPLLFASIGASAVLVFGVPHSPFSQPRSVIGGHFLSAFAGVSAHFLFPDTPILAVSLAATFAGALMLITNTMHPPGGATALLATLGFKEFEALGYWFLITPCATSAAILCFFGILINNMSKMRKYPQFWW